jgi:hypothetical protein
MRKESECEEYNRRSSRIPLAIPAIQVADVAGNTAKDLDLMCDLELAENLNRS